MNAPDLAIRPGVAAIVRDQNGSLLLHWRRVGGGWAPISGRIEPGEDVLTALYREIHEETALQVSVERLVGVYSDPAFQVVRYPDGRAVQFVTCLFACRRTGGTLRGSAEGSAWKWFAPDDLPEGLLAYAKIWLRDAFSPLGNDLVIR